MSEWHRVAALAELEPDYPKGVKAGGQEIALYLVEGHVYATSNVCSHAYALLSDGFVEEFTVICPLHQGSFDIRTGAVIDLPCTDPIATFDCKVDGDDVFVKIGATA
jgi:nitrite reductase/ring-hydroxylating ferredoxin subunit